MCLQVPLFEQGLERKDYIIASKISMTLFSYLPGPSKHLGGHSSHPTIRAVAP